MAATHSDEGTPSETTFYFLRHGETHWNVAGFLQGQNDTPLNDIGRAQAHASGEYLRDKHSGIAAIISSDLGRARETAEIVGKLVGLPVHTCSGLRETHLGWWQGLTWDEANDYYAMSSNMWREDPYCKPVGGGESFDLRFCRMVTCIHIIAALYPGQKVIVVSHGGALDDVARIAKRVPFGKGTGVRKANAAVNIVRFAGNISWRAESDGDSDLVPAVIDTTCFYHPPDPLAGKKGDVTEEDPEAKAIIAGRPLGEVPSPLETTSQLLAPRGLLERIARVFRGGMDPEKISGIFGTWDIVEWGLTFHMREADASHGVASGGAGSIAPTSHHHVSEGDIAPSLAPVEVIPTPNPAADAGSVGNVDADASQSTMHSTVAAGHASAAIHTA